MHSYLDLVEKGHLAMGMFSPRLTTHQAAIEFLEKHKNEHALQQSEIVVLQAITTVDIMKESTLAQTWRNNKYVATMCGFSFDLLMVFLQDNNHMLLLSILNQYISLNGN